MECDYKKLGDYQSSGCQAHSKEKLLELRSRKTLRERGESPYKLKLGRIDPTIVMTLTNH